MGGKQYRRAAGTRSWKKAEAVKAQLTAELTNNPKAAIKASTPTIRAAYDSFIRDKEVQDLSAGILRQYRRELGRFVTFCEGRGMFALESITLPTLTEYRATWPEQYPSSYTRKFVQVRLRVFLHYCHNAEWLTRVPKMAPVKVHEVPTMPLTTEEYTRLLAAVPEEFKNGRAARVRAIIQLMRWSGLAIRDASTLKRSELVLDQARGIYRVTTARQKSGVSVCVPLPREVGDELEAFQNSDTTADDKHLFWDARASKAETFAHLRGLEITAAFTRAGIHTDGHMVSHRLRDTFAVDLLEKGVPLEAVSKMLGHKSIVTTEQHYAQWVKGRQDRLDALVTQTWAARKS
jgi:site-specific recombinase XerD